MNLQIKDLKNTKKQESTAKHTQSNLLFLLILNNSIHECQMYKSIDKLLKHKNQ